MDINRSRLVIISVLALLTAIAMGLSISYCRTAPPADGRPIPAEQTISLDEPLLLWRCGETAAALTALAGAPWDDRRADFTLPLLTMSERTFARRSASERAELQQEALILAGHLRSLARGAQAEYNRLKDEDEPEQAEQLMASLEHLAARLHEPNRLAIFNMVGDAIANVVEQHRDMPAALPAR